MANEKKSLSVSFQRDTDSEHGVIEHNNRIFTAKNVDESRTKDNIIFVQQDLREKYDELFGAAVEKYNAKQTRSDRKISSYYDHIANGKQERLFHEIVVAFGNSEDGGEIGGELWNLKKELCEEYYRDFEKRNPNLKPFNVVLHLDEKNPHLHIDFVPVTYTVKRGMSVKNSMKSALIEQGFKAESRSVNELTAWEESERKAMTEILRRHNLDRDYKNNHRKHMTVNEYKDECAERDKVKSQALEYNARINKLKEKGAEHFSPEDAQLINNQNDVMRAKIIEQQEQITALVRRYNSPLVRFDVYNQDKLLYIAKQLDEMRIQYFEEGDALIVPEYVLGECKKWANSFKSIAPTIKEQIKMDIDVYLLSSENLEQLFGKLQEKGYEIKQGKYIAVKPPNAQRFTRLKTLGYEYLPENLEKRIAERDNFPKKVRDKYESANEYERVFHSQTLQVIESVKTLTYYPKKTKKDVLYSFENDSIINRLSKQLKVMNEFDIHSAEKLYRVLSELEQKMENDQGCYNEMQREYKFLEKDIQGIVSAATLERYEKLSEQLPSFYREIQKDKEKFLVLSEIAEKYEYMQKGDYISRLIAEQKKQEEQDRIAREQKAREQEEKARKAAAARENALNKTEKTVPAPTVQEQNKKTYKPKHR